MALYNNKLWQWEMMSLETKSLKLDLQASHKKKKILQKLLLSIYIFYKRSSHYEFCNAFKNIVLEV